MEIITEKNTTLSETHGDQIGEKKVTSESLLNLATLKVSAAFKKFQSGQQLAEYSPEHEKSNI